MTLDSSSRGARECGVFLPLVAMAVVAFFGLVGLAIDSARFYDAQLAAQGAADSGAIAGAGLMAEFNGWDDVENGDFTAYNATKTRAISTATKVINANLAKKGVPVLDGYPIVSYSDADNQLSVEVKVAMTPMFMAMAALGNWTGQALNASAKSKVSISPAIISLILDTSNSMICPTDTALTDPSAPACSCFPDCAASFTAAGDQKIEALKAAVAEFLGYFDATRDRINMVAYGTGAKVMVPMNTEDSFNRAQFNTQLGNLVAAGQTNTADAFFRAYRDVFRAGGNRAVSKVAYVHFADGAPSAVRFVAKDIVSHPDDERPWRTYVTNNVLNESWSDYDYINWSVNAGCGADYDKDGIINSADNCKTIANPDQTDSDDNGVGDVCDGIGDADSDGVLDGDDNCIAQANPGGFKIPLVDANGDGQWDKKSAGDNDNDGIGDACEDGCNDVRKSIPNILYGTPPDNPAHQNYWEAYGFADVDPSPVAHYEGETFVRGAKRIAWSKASYTSPWQAYSNVMANLVIYLPDGSARCVRPVQWEGWNDFGRCTQSNPPNCASCGTFLRTSRVEPNGERMYTWTFNNGDHLRFYADVALLYGDFMREKGGKWYTIGHGRASSVVTDAYQGVDNLVARKDVLLARTANDLCADFNQQFPGYETSLSMRTPRLTGVYYPEGTAEELAEAFKAVAKKIKLSLVM